MKKLIVLVSMAAVVAVLVAGLTGVFGKSETPAAYASRLAGISSNGVTGIQVQNLDPTQTAQIIAEFYEQKTGAKTTINLAPTAPGAAANMYLPNIQELKNGAYAAIISADRQIAAIANTVWSTSGAQAAYSNVKPGTDVIVPLAAKRFAGQSSIVSIQNTDPSASATAEVSLYKQGDTSPLKTLTVQIPGGTSTTLDLARDVTNFGTVADGFLGLVRVTSATPVAVQSFMDLENQTKAVYAFEGVPSDEGADKLFVPLFRRNMYGTTGISVVNPGSTEVTVNASFTGSYPDSCKGQTFTADATSIPAGSSVVFYQGPNIPGFPQHNIPDGCLGSAVLTATGGKIMAIVNDAGTGTSAAYNAVSAAMGARKVALPLFRKKHLGSLTTGIQAMNIGSSPATATITFKSETQPAGYPISAADGTKVIGPNESFTWYPPSISGIPDNTYGSASIESDQPLAVIVNDADASNKLDSAIYNGIKADVP